MKVKPSDSLPCPAVSIGPSYGHIHQIVKQGDIESQTLSNALKTKLKIEKTAEGLQIIFPADIDYKKINGTISLYRPSNQKLDFETKISLSSPIMLIPKHKLVGGLWEISINWKVDELTYLNKETVYF